MAKVNTKSSHPSQQALYNCFQFNEADLAANRLGLFSEKQKKDWTEYQRNSKRASIIVSLICIGIGLVILFLLIGLPLLQGSRMDWVDVGNMLSSILIPLVFLGIGIGSLFSGLWVNVDVSKHNVHSIEGPINIVEVGNAVYRSPHHRRRILYELRVGTKEFDAYHELPDVLVQGDIYKIYFDDADNEILSVEWTSKG